MYCADDLGFKDENVNPFDSYPPTLTEDPTPGSESFPPFPAVAPVPAAPPATHATSTQYPPHKLRSCEKKTDLYILQPERLNTSGLSYPLKGKLTNCHVTRCERYVSFSMKIFVRALFDVNCCVYSLKQFQAVQRPEDTTYKFNIIGSRYTLPMW